MRHFFAAILALVVSGYALSQTYTIETLAGGPPANSPATSASLRKPYGVAADRAGNLYFTDGRNVVLRLDAATGLLTTVAGNGGAGYGGDNGPATNAQLKDPFAVAVDSAGNLFIADRGNSRIRRVSKGVITTVAGNGTAGYNGDNVPATSAQLNSPSGVAVDAAGSVYIADTENYRVRRVSNGVIVTVAGNGMWGYGGDNGPAAAAVIDFPVSVAVGSTGDLYITDFYNNRIRRVSNGVITTVAGNGTAGFGGDNGPAPEAQLYNPQSVAVDSAGDLYIADRGNARIRKVSNGTITTVAGKDTTGSSGDDGPATSAELSSAYGVAVDFTGNLYIADTLNYRIRRVSDGVIATVAGNGELSYSGDNGPAIGAGLKTPYAVAVDSANNVYIADQDNNRIRKVSNGVMTTVAGGGLGNPNRGENIPATSAGLYAPVGVALDSAGNLYLSDTRSIFKVSNGVITMTAGCVITPVLHCYITDGGATTAWIHPYGIAVDSAGTVYFADGGDGEIRKVWNGRIVTVASGFDFTEGVAVDSSGNLYVTDTGMHNPNIRKISDGAITTVTGSCCFFGFSGIAVDSAGALYIANPSDNRIFKVSNGVMTTVAGNGTAGLSGDNGPATSAQLNQPTGIAVDAAGNVYVADSANDRIRVLVPSPYIRAVANAASNVIGAISPGEIVVFYGSGIGPPQLVQATPGSAGFYGTQLAGTSVSFNGIGAPMIYAWGAQTAAIVPYGVVGTNAQVTVTYHGQTSAAFSVPIVPAAPGVFTLGSTGQGPVAAINQDGITVNSASAPANIGDIISLYATGEGATTPSGVDGKPASVPYPHPNLSVTATVGGQDAPVNYVGGAPGLVAGVMQVNVQIPSGIQTGDAVPVVLRVGDAFSQGDVTIAVR